MVYYILVKSSNRSPMFFINFQLTIAFVSQNPPGYQLTYHRTAKSYSENCIQEAYVNTGTFILKKYKNLH